MKFIVIAIILTLLNGCVGAYLVEDKTRSSNDLIEDYESEHPKLLNPKFSDITKQHVLDLWGRPNSIKNVDNPNKATENNITLETWVYDRKIAISGAIPSIIIPVPIPIIWPSGTRSTFVNFKNEIVYGVYEEYGKFEFGRLFAGCVFLPLSPLFDPPCQWPHSSRGGLH